jgi:hypothetical protein
VPLKVPAAAGVNCTLTWQLAPAAKLDELTGHPLFTSVKSVPETAMEVNVRLCAGKAPPLRFLMVTTSVALLPCATLPKLTGSGETFTSLPVPLSEIFCGVSVALSEMLMEPARALMSCGEKVTLTLQVALVASVVPQVLLVGT